MILDEKVSLLQKSFLFAELSREELETIAHVAEVIDLDPRVILIHENDEADGAYIIDQGSLKIYSITQEGKEIPLNIAKRGDIVGEMSIIDDLSRSANVETLTETRLLKISTTNFRAVLLEKPHIALQLLKSLSKKIRKVDKNLSAFHTESTLQLTLHMLQTLARAYENNVIPLTHDELSRLVGVTRPRVTESLHKLEKLGLIEISSKKITLL